MRRSFPSVVALLICAALVAGGRHSAADDGKSLSHEAAMRLAAERNLALLAKALERQRLGYVADTARRPYLPELGLEGAVRETPGQPRRALELIPSITYETPYGTTVQGAAAMVEGVADNPQSERRFTIEVSQALLRGGFYPGGAADLRQADLDVRIERELFRTELNALLVRADRAYWELAIAHEDVEIRRRSRDRARAQFEETEENIRRGLLAPGEIYIVEENLVDFEERLSRAEEGLALAESSVRRILHLPSSSAVRASSPIDSAFLPEPSEADSLQMAATHNPEVLAARLAVRRADIGIGGDERQALPKLDVFGSLGVVSGTDALANTLPADPELRAGARLSVPLYWGPDAARVRRARTEHSQRRLQLLDAEEAAFTVVRDTAIKIRARKRRLDLASKIVELSRKKLEVERDKYKSGLTTLADVVRFQRELDAALSSALRARIDVLTARAEILAARGDLHDAVKVAVR